jgi:hypothetical protein
MVYIENTPPRGDGNQPMSLVEKYENGMRKSELKTVTKKEVGGEIYVKNCKIYFRARGFRTERRRICIWK